jgi:hypothetical protein
MCLNKRSLTKKHSILILKIKEKLLALRKLQKDIKFVWIPVHTGTADVRQRIVFGKGKMPNIDSWQRLEEPLEDQTESSNRGMVQRIWKTERKEVL